MPGGEPVAVTVELERGAEPIAGVLRIDSAPAVPFRGWLALCAMLRSAAQGDADPHWTAGSPT